MTSENISLEELTLRQLRKVASDFNVSRYSRMRKEQLIEEILKAQGIKGTPVSISVIADQEEVEASKFDVGQTDRVAVSLAEVDAGLPDLPEGYGESRIVLLPRDPQWSYVYWDIPNEHKQDLRRQGGIRLALRFYDVTDVDMSYQRPHSLQQYEIDELSREWYLPIPVSDRDYMAEIGYVAADGRWLMLARSLPVHVPPVYPSDWIDDQFVSLGWEEELRGKTVLTLVPPSKRVTESNKIYDQIFGMAQSAESQRLAGSLFGSMQHVAGSVFGSVHMVESISSYVFPSGVGMWAVPNASGLTMSGAGFSGSLPVNRPRQFWLIADAELIVYGATEPDATVTIGGRPIKLSPDGTFRFQMSFQDGMIDFPIVAVAADGEQTRSITWSLTAKRPSAIPTPKKMRCWSGCPSRRSPSQFSIVISQPP